MKKILIFSFISLLLALGKSFSQASSANGLMKLNHLVGEWIGESITFENDSLTGRYPAYQEIAYGLDSMILVIDLHSEPLELHTVITYDPVKDNYLYHSFSKKGARTLPAKFEDGKLIVQANDSRRFTFIASADGLTEFGEILDQGTWKKYFEDSYSRLE